jgi:hypothetical protein
MHRVIIGSQMGNKMRTPEEAKEDGPYNAAGCKEKEKSNSSFLPQPK